MTLPSMFAAATLSRTHLRKTISRFHFQVQTGQPGRLRIALHDRQTGAEAGHLQLVRQSEGRFAVYDLFIEKPYRGKFLSREMMARAARSAKLQGGRKLWLEAEPGGDMPRPVLYRIYQRMGFRTLHTDPHTGRPQMEVAIR